MLFPPRFRYSIRIIAALFVAVFWKSCAVNNKNSIFTCDTAIASSKTPAWKESCLLIHAFNPVPGEKRITVECVLNVLKYAVRGHPGHYQGNDFRTCPDYGKMDARYRA
jgi:hypothetical protein